MDWRDLVIQSYERVSQVLGEALNGLSQEDLNRQPAPDSNSIGWMVWHLTRIQDKHFSSLMGEEQLWIKEKWYAVFKRAADPAETGFGHTAKDLAAFKSPAADDLLGYHRAVLERTRRFLEGLPTADLDREPPVKPPPTIGERLVRVLSDSMQHTGQVTYLRGWLKGKGWAP